MSRLITSLFASAAVAALAAPSSANPNNWISMPQAIAAAQSAVGGVTPIKAELESDGGPLVYEIKAFAGNILFEIKVDPATGTVVDVDSSSGGGAQSKIAEAQQILSQSAYTLVEAIEYAESLFPNGYIVEIEMRYRNGIPVFDADLARGPYRFDLHFRVTDGVIVKQQTKLYGSSSDFYNLYVPGPGVNWNLSNLTTLVSVIDAAQSQFNGKVFDIELNKISSSAYRYEVRVLTNNNTVVRAKYNAKTGALIKSKVLSKPDYVNKVQTSVNNASLTLKQAINAAKAVVPQGTVVEAQLQIGDSKRRYEVTFLTPSGMVEVKVNSVTGAVTSIKFGN